ncbi:MAG: radical SAM-associated putative lipoprotein [Bacteroidales bacterium]|nr:radical SAM-associated putative lipoprotein [Bacteroidales bacterium]
MQKNFRYYYLKFITVILLTVGMIVGFTTKIIAQYGAPVVDFFMKGKVYSKATQQPIPNISIMQGYGGEVKTDKNGEFGMPALVDWGAKLEFLIQDKDGEENGIYQSKLINFKERINRNDTVEINLYIDEEPQISEIVRTNNFPTKLNGKEIIYTDIIYIYPSGSMVLNIESLAQYKNDVGTVFFNDISLTRNQLFTNPLTFYIDKFQKVNYLLIDVNIQQNETSQKVLLYTFPNKEIILKQSKDKIEAVIIYVLEPENE